MTSSPLSTLLRGVQKVITEEDLQSKIKKGKPLRVKLGVDPTAPDLHLGHTVALGKLKAFQDQGHKVVFIIGDYTARVGDPSGRSETRLPLSADEVDRNAQTYLDQVFQILDRKSTEVRRNSEWLEPLFANRGTDTLLGLLSKHTVQQLTEREDFSARLEEGNPISLLELLYPLMQGYDSVAVKADVELGGTDQLFNLLMGRKMQKDAGQEPQVVMTLPLLEGTDGVRKMSKSYGNAVLLRDGPAEMFGKIMSLPDALMWKYFELLTEENLPAVKALHPMEAKKNLAGLITARYHGEGAAGEARKKFDREVSGGETPEKMIEHRVSQSSLLLADLMLQTEMVSSKNEAYRLIRSGAVYIDGEKVLENRPLEIRETVVLKAGKGKFRRILPPH